MHTESGLDVQSHVTVVFSQFYCSLTDKYTASLLNLVSLKDSITGIHTLFRFTKIPKIIKNMYEYYYRFLFVCLW